MEGNQLAIQNIYMPQLGESVTEGTIEKWLVKPGDQVNKYDPLAEVNTDKVNAEIPSSFSGTIEELIAKEGETLAVDAVVCTIEVEEAEGTTTKKLETRSVKNETKTQALETQSNKTNLPRYSPAVLRLSQEHNIDLSLLEGTGRGGRITRKDVQKVIDSGELQTKDTMRKERVEPVGKPRSKETTEQDETRNVSGDLDIPVSGVRRAIATKMVTAVQEIPHAWMTVEVDVTNLVAYRDSLKTQFKEREGFNLTYFAFFVKAVSQALKEFPLMNSMWAGDKIVQKKAVNLSIAVATDDALFVPVIKHADEKTIKGISREIHELATKARTGKLTTEEMQDGTFTVNNTGSFGSIQSMGIINHPQAAILQVESIVKRPVILDGGMIAPRDMVNLCLSIDHRVLDGLISGRFLARVKEILESICAETTSIY